MHRRKVRCLYKIVCRKLEGRGALKTAKGR